MLRFLWLMPLDERARWKSVSTAVREWRLEVVSWRMDISSARAELGGAVELDEELLRRLEAVKWV